MNATIYTAGWRCISALSGVQTQSALDSSGLCQNLLEKHWLRCFICFITHWENVTSKTTGAYFLLCLLCLVILHFIVLFCTKILNQEIITTLTASEI